MSGCGVSLSLTPSLLPRPSENANWHTVFLSDLQICQSSLLCFVNKQNKNSHLTNLWEITPSSAFRKAFIQRHENVFFFIYSFHSFYTCILNLLPHPYAWNHWEFALKVYNNRKLPESSNFFDLPFTFVMTVLLFLIYESWTILFWKVKGNIIRLKVKERLMVTCNLKIENESVSIGWKRENATEAFFK